MSLKRSAAAVLILAACEQAFARNAARPWEDKSTKKPGQIEDKFERYDDFAEAIGFWGYSWEPHHVTTRDGFKLTLFRITGGPPEGFV